MTSISAFIAGVSGREVEHERTHTSGRCQVAGVGAAVGHPGQIVHRPDDGFNALVKMGFEAGPEVDRHTPLRNDVVDEIAIAGAEIENARARRGIDGGRQQHRVDDAEDRRGRADPERQGERGAIARHLAHEPRDTVLAGVVCRQGVLGPGKDALIRMTYSKNADGSVRQHGEQSTDGPAARGEDQPQRQYDEDHRDHRLQERQLHVAEDLPAGRAQRVGGIDESPGIERRAHQATCVALKGRALLIEGAPSTGKSSLALALIAVLVQEGTPEIPMTSPLRPVAVSQCQC